MRLCFNRFVHQSIRLFLGPNVSVTRPFSAIQEGNSIAISGDPAVTSSGGGGGGEGGPGLAYMPFVVMEDLLDKLKLLNYEEQFVKDLKMRPLTRHYFVIQTNPGEQFFLFTSLAAWLIR